MKPGEGHQGHTASGQERASVSLGPWQSPVVLQLNFILLSYQQQCFAIVLQRLISDAFERVFAVSRGREKTNKQTNSFLLNSILLKGIVIRLLEITCCTYQVHSSASIFRVCLHTARKENLPSCRLFIFSSLLAQSLGDERTGSFCPSRVTFPANTYMSALMLPGSKCRP